MLYLCRPGRSLGGGKDPCVGEEPHAWLPGTHLRLQSMARLRGSYNVLYRCESALGIT